MQGADILIEALRREEITHVFGLPGTTVMDIIDALARQEELRYLSVRHEQVAGFMADGFARGAGRPAVALASRGPGAANLTIAVHNAHAESIPLIAIVGQVSDDIAYRDAFEETDLVAFFTPITKWAVEVRDVDRIPELVQRAVRTAVSGRPGPVLISIPLNVQTADGSPQFQPRFRALPPAPDTAGLQHAVEMLAGAHRPVIIAGGGVLNGSYDAGLDTLARTLAAPVVSTWMRKNAVANAAPYFLGSMGYGASKVTEQVVAQADVVLALGCRFSEFSTKRYSLINPDSRLIHVDIDAAELGHIYIPELGLQADAAAVTGALAAAFAEREPSAAAPVRQDRLSTLREEYLDSIQAPEVLSTTALVQSGEVVPVLQRLMQRPDITLVQDVHTFGPWIQRFVDFDRAGSYFAAAGGSMGWGMPAALGIALARPDTRVVAISGDGSFFMVAQDLETAVREGIPVVNIVINNFAFGNTRDRQRFAHDGRYLGVFYGNPDFAAYAELLGAYGERVEKAGDLEAAIDRALASGRPAVIDVIQDELEGLPGDLQPPGTQ